MQALKTLKQTHENGQNERGAESRYMDNTNFVTTKSFALQGQVGVYIYATFSIAIICFAKF